MASLQELAEKASRLKQQGQLQAALATYQEALNLDKTVPELWFNYGNLLQKLARRADAEAAYRQALAIQPDFYQAYLNLANSLRDRGASEAAIDCYKKALQLKPDLILAYRNLAGVLMALQRSGEAEKLFAAWCRIEPQNPTPWNGLGICLQERGCYEDALQSFQQAFTLDRDRFDSLNNLGILLRMLRRPHEAVGYLRQAIAKDPKSETALTNLAYALLNLGRVSEAIAQIEAALECHPNSSTALMMRGFALVQQARIVEALSCFERAWQLDNSNKMAVTNALFAMLFRDDISSRNLKQELCSWVERLPKPPFTYQHWQCEPSRDRPLKVGYLSADFRSHPVAFFLEPILTHHDRDRFEIFGYDTAGVEDATTARLKSATSQWCNCVNWSDARLAEKIHADAIDILVDLSGYTAGNRASVFDYKPAPVQILYIGYPCTTGSKAIDYIISDRAVSPVELESLYTENILRVEGSFWCFRPHDFAPDPGDLPLLTNGYVTFGSFNQSAKLSPSTFDLWARVLQAVPNSKLILKALALKDEKTSDRFRQPFLERQINAERIILEEPTLQLEKFFESYHKIDIALDPVPYTGGTTTCESLWMGVPVVTLRGGHFFARMSHSFLQNVGLSDLSTGSEREYVAAAAKLASDRDRLRDLRRTLRVRMADSPICDGRRAARELETAYDRAWKAFCDRD